jgi:hypothetical protein
MLRPRVFNSMARWSELQEDLNIPLIGLTLAHNSPVTLLDRTSRAPASSAERLERSADDMPRRFKGHTF